MDSGLERARRRLAFWATRHQELVAVHLEPDLRRLSSGRRTVRLTGRESELLKFLLDHPGRRYPAPLLATLAWHDSGLCAEQVRTYVARLRRKLREADAQLDISSQRRLGYGVAGTQRGAGARDRTDEA